jgi:hypothetical protein
MQPSKFYISIFVLLFLTFSSCKKEDVNATNPATDSTSTPQIDNTPMQQGKWKVILFQEGSNVETASFSGYEFTFQDNGGVVAQKDARRVTGGWIMGSGNRYGKFILAFGQTDPFEDISEDWTILEKTPTRLRLEHISGGDGSKELLTFEKL